MPKKAKSFKDSRTPEQKALDSYLKSDKRSKLETSKILHSYIDSDSTEQSYYQRICKLATGEAYVITDQERKAIKHFLNIEANPHTYGKTFYQLDGIERKLNQLERFLNSGYINKAEANKRIKELKQLIPIADSQYFT